MIPSLVPSYPRLIDIAEETLGIRHAEFSSAESLLMSAFSLLTTPHSLTLVLRCRQDAPLPPAKSRFSSSVNFLSSDHFRRQVSLGIKKYLIFR